MRKTGKLVSLALAGMMLLAACGEKEEAAGGTGKSGGDGEKTYKIGISQFATHPSLDAATEGFKKALEEKGLKVDYDEQNAQADQNNTQPIAENFAGDNVDLIFANATPSAIAALNVTKDIPILFTSVTDPVGAGLVKSFDEPGDNITGTTDNHPDATKKTIDFITKEVGAKKIGIVYNSGEQNSVVQVEAVEKLAKDNGASLVKVSVSTSAEVKQAAESLDGRVDAIYIPTDNTVVSALDSVISVANSKKIPLFVGELDSMKKGAVAASGFSYYDLGYETGQMAAEILTGKKKPSEIPVALPQSLTLMINKKAAEEQGLEVKEEWKNAGEFYEGE